MSLYASWKKKRPNTSLPRTPKRFRRSGTPFKRKNVTPLSKTPKRHRIQLDNDQWEDVENTYILNEESFENVEHEEDVKGSERHWKNQDLKIFF